MSTVIDSIEQRQKRRVPRFDAGDRVRVHFQVIEGSRKRTQVFEGVVMKRQGNGLRETFTVRKQSFGVGVERTFPLHSPKIERLEVAARGDVRRAKLYYLRDRIGKAARVAERRWGIEEDLLGAEEDHALAADGGSQEDLGGEAGDEIGGEPGEPAGEPVAEQAATPDDAAAAESAAGGAESGEPKGELPEAGAEEPESGGEEDVADEAQQPDQGEEPAAADEEAKG